MNAQTKSRKLCLAVLLLSGTALTGLPMAAQAQNWTGVTSTDWFTASNWDTNAVPTAADLVTLSTLSPNPTLLSGGNGFADGTLVGAIGSGSLTISGGGTLTNTAASVSSIGSSGGTGAVLITGTGSSFIAAGSTLIVGFGGNGTLSLASGGTASAGGLILGVNSGNSSVSVDGTGSLLTATNLSLVEGPVSGPITANLSITNGGHVVVANAFHVGDDSGQATMTVDGAGSLLQSGADTAIGGFTINGGNASVSVLHGASFISTGDIDIGGTISSSAASAVGTVLVDGAGSQFNSAGNIIVGYYGTGSLTVQNGGQIDTGMSLFAGVEAGSNGTIVITGAGSNALLTGGPVIGTFGTGSLSVLNGATLSGVLLDAGFAVDGVGTVTVDGAGSLVAISDHLYIGALGTSTLTISGGGTFNSANISEIGYEAGAIGTVTVTGQNSTFTASANLIVGDTGTGTLVVQNGGLVNTVSTVIGASAGGVGTVTVTGAGSSLQGSDALIVGDAGTGTLSVLNGASATAFRGILAGNTIDSVGTATVDGAGSTWTSQTSLIVGDFGTGNLTVSNGGAVNTTDLIVGSDFDAKGAVTISDASSQLNASGMVNIGVDGTGQVSVGNGAVLSAPAGITLAVDGGSVGELDIGAAPPGAPTAPGIIDSPTITTGAGHSIISFNHTSTNYVFAPVITGQGLIATFAGTTILTADSSGFTGGVELGGGTLLVNGTLGGQGALVLTGATLGGGGHLMGEADFADGGILKGVQGQTLTIDQHVILSNASVVDATLGAPGGAALFHVGQDLTLDGVLNITAAPGFNAGIYRLFDYGGTLFDNTLDIGATPTGTDASEFSIQTSVTGQVNLIDTHQASLSFWDGAAPGNANNGLVDGGSGVWSATAPNWTDPNGVVNGAMLPQPGFAVFESAPGTVTVDASAGAITVSGMQFASDGYVVNGDPIGLAAAQTVVRVGDGTAAGAGYVATIASVLTGTGALVKDDLGTLILIGNNTYTGGTDIEGGVLQIGNGGTTGAVAGDINDNATLVIDRSDAVDFTNAIFSNNGIVVQAGSGTTTLDHNNTYGGQTIIANGTLVGTVLSFGSSSILDNAALVINQATDADFVNVISGTGSLTKQGVATVTLTGANTYSGGTTISTGSLVGSSTSFGTGAITDNAVLVLDQPTDAIFANTVTGTGSVTKLGTATLTLGGVNTYAGGTVINAGTLVGSVTSFGAGAIVDNTALVLDQPADAVFSNTITGTGSVTKQGAGKLGITGTNSYTGGTTIAAGTLELGSGGTSGSIAGNVTDNGTLSFNRSDAVSFSGIISGTGAVNQAGTGTTTLTGANSYAGGTTISAGTLVGLATSFGAGAIADNAALVINQGANATFANPVTGAGSLTKQGAGTLTVTGTNSYAGGTTISAGTLTGSATSFGTGAIADNAALVLDQAADATFGNLVAGTGSLTKQGAGKLGITGTDTYTGGTTIAGGTLELGSGGSTGAITGDVADNGALNFNRSDAVSFAGVISGTGAVNQVGSGSTTLASANTYTGGTLIASGTLVGTAASFGPGGIVDNGVLVINQAADAPFANVIAGTGSFTKQGAGSLNLTGASTLSGATTVAAGRLAVNGSLANSVVTVQNGATLGGNGTVGGIIAQTGSNVGPGNSIGNLTVAGNYSAASGSIYQVELDSAGNADRLTVNGTATIANGAIIDVTKTDSVPFVLGTQYTVLTAAGGVSGTFAVTGAPATGAFTALNLTSDAHDVYLVYTQTKSFASVGGTANQIATGGGADSAAPSSALVGALLGLPNTAAAQGAFDQLSGEAYASIKSAQIENSRFPREAILRRLDVGAKQGSNAPDLPSLWGQVYGSWGSTDGNGNAATLGYSSRGLLGGVDLPVFETWRVGVLGGYSRDSEAVTGRNSTAVSDNYHLGGYAGTQSGPFAMRAGIVYSWHDVTAARAVDFASFSNQLAGSYTGGAAQAFGEVGYHLNAGTIALEPFANIAHVSLQSGGFTETGGPAALTVQGDHTNVTFTTLGLRGAYDVDLGGTTFLAHGALGWRHAFGDLLPSSIMSFQTGNAFTIQGVPVAQDGASIGAGFDLPVARDVLVGISYDGQFASSASDNAVKFDLNWKL